MSTVKITIPPLPEGWVGTPDDLIVWINENNSATQEGDVPAGQVGGSQPTEDVGLFYGVNSIERFVDGKYRPISDVPIGALLPSAIASAVVPENYLIADGRSLIRADYPELFLAVGVAWGSESDTTFNLPDLRGRSPVGAGIGDYKPQTITGRMKEVVFGSYFGFEWTKQEALPSGSPISSMKSQPQEAASVNKYNSDRNPSIGVTWLIRYR